jgi:hypothetical protein
MYLASSEWQNARKANATQNIHALAEMLISVFLIEAIPTR